MSKGKLLGARAGAFSTGNPQGGLPQNRLGNNGLALGPHCLMEPGRIPRHLRQGRGSYLVLSLRLCSQEQPSSSQCPARSKK